MAYVATGDVKKFIKIAGVTNRDESFSRSFSGLNISTETDGGGIGGLEIAKAAEFFSQCFADFSTNSVTKVYYGTEELLDWQL